MLWAMVTMIQEEGLAYVRADVRGTKPLGALGVPLL